MNADRNVNPSEPRRIKRKVWANVYLEPEFAVFCANTREEADGYADHNGRVACIPLEIDYTEGEGL
jgi:hypothetical protein